MGRTGQDSRVRTGTIAAPAPPVSQPGTTRRPINGPMGTNGDITDEFDDDSLKRSIESATKDGRWKDDNAAFVDPKLREIEQKLATVPSESYTERRLRELQQRVARKEQKAATRAAGKNPVFAEEPRFVAPPEPPPPEPELPPSNWRETVVRVDTAPVLPPSPSLVSASQQLVANTLPTAVAWARSIGAAALVFTAAVAVHGLLGGWSSGLFVRGTLAAIAAGIAWHLLAAGRFRAAAIGTAAHMMAFLTTSQASDGTQLLAVFASMLITLLGAGAVGIANESGGSHRPLGR